MKASKMRNHLKVIDSSWLLVLFVTLSVTITIHAYQNQEDLISKSCRSTPDPKTCESSLRSDPRSSTADSEGLALIMVDVVKSNFSNALDYVNKVIEKQPGTGEDIKMLRYCARVYKVVLTADVPVAVDAIKKGDPKFGVDSMSDSRTEADACEEGFTSSKLKSPLTEWNKHLHGIGDIASALIRLLL